MVTSALNHKKQSSPEEPSVDPLAGDDVGEFDVSLVDDGGIEAHSWSDYQQLRPCTTQVNLWNNQQQ